MKRYVQLFENFTSELTPQEQELLDYASNHPVIKTLEKHYFKPVFEFKDSFRLNHKKPISLTLTADHTELMDNVVSAEKKLAFEQAQTEKVTVVYIFIETTGIKWGCKYFSEGLTVGTYELGTYARANYPILDKLDGVCDKDYLNRVLGLLEQKFSMIAESMKDMGYRMVKMTNAEWNNYRIDTTTSDTINNIW